MSTLLPSRRKPVLTRAQWISEVVHFCSGLPIILVGCKADLRDDPNTIEALRATNQKPVSSQDVSAYSHLFITHKLTLSGRGCCQEDWCLQVLGVLCPNRHWRPRGL